MSFGKRKDGRYYRKQRRFVTSDAFPEPPNPPKRNYYFSPDDFRKRADDLRRKREEIRKKRKQEKFNRVINLELGHAKGFLIKATPVLVQLDPTLSAIYTGWKIGQYGYCFLKQVNEEYKRNDNFEESLKTVTTREVENKIVSKIKSIPTEQSFQYAANRIWTLCKERYSDGRIDPKWDNFAENALVKSFEEVWGRLL